MKWARDFDRCRNGCLKKFPHRAKGWCVNCYNRKYYKSNQKFAERVAERAEKWNRDNPKRRLEINAKYKRKYYRKVKRVLENCKADSPLYLKYDIIHKRSLARKNRWYQNLSQEKKDYYNQQRRLKRYEKART